MPATCPYLFVYGTLRRDSAHPMAQLLAANARWLGRATTTGRLYDLGDYPGMLPANVETDIVTGDLYEPRDPDHLLRELDQYEGCVPEHPMPYIFGRELVRVRCNDTEHNAWAYFFRQSVDESQRIASGEYKQRP